jgi:hypothetical protein
MHANAWPLIEKYLKLQKKRQLDLAELLDVTPAAISQFKSERILFNPVQIEKVINFFHLDAAASEEFYSALFAARLLPPQTQQRENCNDPSVWRKRSLPVADLELLQDYDTAAKSMDHFLTERTTKRYTVLCDRPGLCILTVKKIHGISPVLLLDSVSVPQPGQTVLECFSDRSFRIHHPAGNQAGACFNFPGDTVFSEKKVLWRRVILALNVPLE